MSAFKQSMRKLGVRAGLLAGTSAAILAIAGTGTAVANPTCPGGALKGEGSSLQKIAQQNVWNPGYEAACTGSTVTYTSTGSGPGLEAFGYKGGALNKEFQFIGTDDGPNAEQIANAEAAGKTGAVIIPVSQTAIAVDVHLPTGCSFKAGEGITWKDLNKVFGGSSIKKWSDFSDVKGGTACEKAVVRVVRAEGSGTTYQFKNYLQVLHEEVGAESLPCTTEGHSEWGQLLTVGAKSGTKEPPNTTWPECTGSTKVEPVAGGGGVATFVKNNEGTIGYSALPDSKNNGAAVALLQNGQVGEEATFAEPGNSENSTARCEDSRYTVAAESETKGVGRNWSTVFGAQPQIEGEEYPLCTLTYDAGWQHYKTAGYTEAQGKEAIDYLKNYVLAGGQSALTGRWYATLSEGLGVGSGEDVKKAAEVAVEALGL